MLRGVGVAALAFLLLAPAAMAEVSVQVQAPAVPLRSGVPHEGAVVVVVTAECSDLVAGMDPNMPQRDPQYTVEFVSQFALITGPPQVSVPLASCANGELSASGQTAYVVSIPPTAPGLQALPAVVKIAGMTGGPVSQMEASAPIQFTAEYFSASQVRIEPKAKTCACEVLRYDLEVTNFGNARTQYTFEVVEQQEGWDLVLPDTLLLDSPNADQGNSTFTTTVEVHMPKTASGKGTFSVVAHPVSADDPSKAGNDLVFTFSAENDRLVPYTSIPGPATPVLLVALAALALLARRRA